MQASNQSSAPRLVIRADANSRIGTGHLMRCIALGQAWADAGGEVVFITRCETAELLQRLRDENFEVIELKSPDEFLSRLSSDLCPLTSDLWFVLDGYPFTLEDQRAVRATGCKLLVIDDCNHLPQYECDVLLNQNINAAELNYHINPEAKLLLGPRYCLLRREFFQTLEKPEQKVPSLGKTEGCRLSLFPSIGKNMLVTMGGADPDNVTLKVIEALQRVDLPGLNVKIVVGPANPHRASLEEAVQHSASNMELIHSANMAEWMRRADFAVSAAGSTCWELLAMNVPFMTVVLADNQAGVAAWLEQHAGVPCLGRGSDSFSERMAAYLRSPETLVQDRPVRLVDGRGAERVVGCLRKEAAKVSAVVPVYNAENYLAAAVGSLLAQTVPLEKIVLVDDGSTDGSVQLIRQRYARELDSGRIVLHRLPENAGVSAARNTGVSLVETDWFVFLDADDVLAPEAVACLLNRADELAEEPNPYGLIHPAYQMIDDAGTVTSPVHRWRQVGFAETAGWMFYRNHIISPSGLLVNRQQFMELGGFDVNLRYSEDAELWLRFAQVSGIGYVDQPLAFIRRHAANASKQVANMLQGEATILRRYPLETIRQAIFKRDCPPAKNIADFVSILYRLGEWETGYQEATQADSKFFTGLYWLKRGELRRALNDFLQCDQTPNPNGAVLNNIGACYLALGEPEQAAAYLDRALEMHPNYMDAQANKDLLQSPPIEPGQIKFTWRELRPVMISYTG